MKIAVILFNLGGPDSPDAVEPYLRNLFSDRAIIALPAIFRLPLAWFIAWRRAPITRAIYEKLGGSSPIVPQTERQARALEAALAERGHEAKAFIAMRAWKPFAREAARAAKAWGAERVVLLPLYPQYSTATTASSLAEWAEVAAREGLATSTGRVCCYPWATGFVDSIAEMIGAVEKQPGVDYRLLLSAHGLPKRMIGKGDPYRWQVEKTAAAIVGRLGIVDFSVCYQSRVGPLEWIGPATDAEIRRAGADGKGVILAPIAFVSEHSETLVELDIDYAHVARDAGVPHYARVPAVGARPGFIAALADLVVEATRADVVSCGGGRICPRSCGKCGWGSSISG
ncbi:MAG TPA: ferrochelatase [Rhizomicrobium sp.]